MSVKVGSRVSRIVMDSYFYTTTRTSVYLYPSRLSFTYLLPELQLCLLDIDIRSHPILLQKQSQILQSRRSTVVKRSMNFSQPIHLLLPDKYIYAPLFSECRRLRKDIHALGVSARRMVVRIDTHVDVPFVGFEEFEVEASEESGNTHVEFCVCEAREITKCFC